MTLTKEQLCLRLGARWSQCAPQILSDPVGQHLCGHVLTGDPVCQPTLIFGAMFGVFNVDGQPNKSLLLFQDINDG